MKSFMEKEINIEIGLLSTDFYYENFEFTKDSLVLYEDCMRLAMQSMEIFIRKELKISYKLCFNLNLATDTEIIQLNLDYRGKNSVTDVLSFPLQENLRRGELDLFLGDDQTELELGDIFICHSVCEKQALDFNIAYADEFIHLLVHGFLHLCGFNHEENEFEEKLMESFEKLIIDKIETKK